jgi:hypothetical protein
VSVRGGGLQPSVTPSVPGKSRTEESEEYSQQVPGGQDSVKKWKTQVKICNETVVFYNHLTVKSSYKDNLT